MADQQAPVTVIAPGTSISGQMSFQGPASILGSLEGSITSADRVEVGAEATVAATVDAQTVLVDGTIEGDVTARDRLQMNATAKLRGDVLARTLIVSEGASFVGHCRVGSDAAELAANKANQQAQQVSELKPEAAETDADLTATRATRVAAVSNGS